MTKLYKRADNCGPVPYPDGSGKMLTEETVDGPEWAALVELGFVVEVDGKPGKRLPDAPRAPRPAAVKPALRVDSKAKQQGQRTKPLDKETSVIEEDLIASKSDILIPSEQPTGAVNVTAERIGVDKVDSAETGSPGAEGTAGRREAD